MTTLTERFRKHRPMPVLYAEQKKVLDGFIRQGRLQRTHKSLLPVFRIRANRRYPQKPKAWREECAHSWLHQYLDDETPWQQFTQGIEA